MQSVVKLSEAGNVFKLSELANNDPDAGFHPSGEAKTPLVIVPDPKEKFAPGHEAASPCHEKESQPAPAAAAPVAADDALAWLKIIEKATADLTADFRASKNISGAPSFALDGDPHTQAASRSTPYSSGGGTEAGEQRKKPYDAGGWHGEHSEHGDERKLAQKLSYRFAEPQRAPVQSLRSALLPYIAATGIFAFLAGSAVAYFVTGSSPSDVKANVAAPSIDAQLDSWMARPDQVTSKKGGLQRASEPSTAPQQRAAEPSVPPVQRTFELPAAPVRTMVMESGESGGANLEDRPKQEEAAAPAGQRVQSWSDTVETFKQFVKSDAKAR